MTKEQIALIEEAFSNGDVLVIQVGDKVYITEEDVLKHKKEATVEFTECSEVDESCFNSDGTYDGDCLEKLYTIILQDPCADNNNAVETVYYEDEIVSIREIRTN